MFIVMRLGTDNPGTRVEGMLRLTMSVIPDGAGFDEAGGGVKPAPGAQHCPRSCNR